MNLINTLIIWSWLLGISLMIPTALPAGGAKKVIVEQRENTSKSPLVSLRGFNLLSTISDKSNVLTSVSSGTPVRGLKVWESPKSGTWLLVSVFTQSSCQLFYKRGWVNTGYFG